MSNAAPQVGDRAIIDGRAFEVSALISKPGKEPTATLMDEAARTCAADTAAARAAGDDAALAGVDRGTRMGIAIKDMIVAPDGSWTVPGRLLSYADRKGG